jgi:peptidoglycan hydrolase-like protein with peptidoglycan-binding domain
MSDNKQTLPVEKIKDEFPDELPSKKLCNRNPPFDPIKGDGPLSNRFNSMMSYSGSDKKELVKTLQMMLNDLGIPDDDGNPLEVDGDFGIKTEQAIKRFQKDHKDWELKDLKTDGLVGPRTSDALNRAMVGIWYKVYETDKELTDGQTFITVNSGRLTEGLVMTVNSPEIDSASAPTQDQPTRRRRDDGRAAFENIPSLIKPNRFEVEILDEKLKKFEKPLLFEVENKEQSTDDRSVLSLMKKKSQVSLIGTTGEEVGPS